MHSLMMEQISRKLFYSGHYFTFNSQKGRTIYYKCSKYDSNNCRARLIIKEDLHTVKGNHTCLIDTSINITPLNYGISPEEFSTNLIIEKAQLLHMYPNQIYESLLLALREQYGLTPYSIPPKKKVFRSIREQRSSIFSNNIQSVTMPPLSDLPNGQPFCRRYWWGDIDGVRHQVLVWCTNEALSLMRYNSHTFIDCTFRSVPSPFLQCLIVMVYDEGTRLFVPCAYCLLTSKNETLYLACFQQLIVLMKFNWMPRIITSDFESSLLKAIRHEFPESRLLGCYFHFKKAIERKLTKYKINFNNSCKILSKMELLTVLPINEIYQGVEYIKTLTTDQQELSLFWIYFTRTWLNRFPPSIWNLSSMNDVNMAGRTNNALERYNRRLGENFSNAHPNLCAFVSVIKIEFQQYSEKLYEIRQNASGIIFETERFTRPEVENEYLNWKRLHIASA